ncbi:MAG TPA: hypothetical protein VM264_06370 [Acidimicrobiales bacterium]|nr:hypothetical protein [Acidimicrobiales bacterium]
MADELRRRRLGSVGLHHGLDRVTRSTWLPGEVDQVPSGLLVLAAVSLVRPRPGR